jgi:hypothetical protein
VEDDQQTWQQGVLEYSRRYEQMADADRSELDHLINRIMQIKEKMVKMSDAAGGAAICHTCGGECCLLGKYHFSAFDLLGYRKSGLEPVNARFTPGKDCPYSGESGCLMPPRFRPMTCVIFNCQQIEDGMAIIERKVFYECEQELRAMISEASRITGYNLERPLLLSC